MAVTTMSYRDLVDSVSANIQKLTSAVNHLTEGAEYYASWAVNEGFKTVCGLDAGAFSSYVAGTQIGNYALSTANKICNMGSLFDGSMRTEEIIAGAVDLVGGAAKTVVNCTSVFSTELMASLGLLTAAPAALATAVACEITSLSMDVKGRIDELTTGVDVQKNAWLAVLKTAAVICAVVSVITAFAASFPVSLGFGVASLAFKVGHDVTSWAWAADTTSPQALVNAGKDKVENAQAALKQIVAEQADVKIKRDALVKVQSDANDKLAKLPVDAKSEDRTALESAAVAAGKAVVGFEDVVTASKLVDREQAATNNLANATAALIALLEQKHAAEKAAVA